MPLPEPEEAATATLELLFALATFVAPVVVDAPLATLMVVEVGGSPAVEPPLPLASAETVSAVLFAVRFVPPAPAGTAS